MVAFVIFLFSPLILWVLFLFAMGIERADMAGKLSPLVKKVAIPFVAVGLLLDAVLNYTYFAITTLDFPRWGEWTFSQRLNRLIKRTDWRGKQATWLADNWLDPFDPRGFHITRG